MKMNYLKVLGMAAVVALTFSCKENQNEVDATAAEEEAIATESSVVYKVDTEASVIDWVGSKPTEDHTGTIALQSGEVTVKGNALESGNFIIDMNSIVVTDLEGDQAASLKAHLTGEREGTSSDFFNTAKYPTAQFTVTGLESKDGKNILSGNLTLKDVTKNVSFPVGISYDGDKMMLNSEEFTIDRTDWGIKYGSGTFFDIAADKAISDDMKLKVNLVAMK